MLANVFCGEAVSRHGIELASLFAATHTGSATFTDLLQQSILQPLNMSHTVPYLTAASVAQLPLQQLNTQPYANIKGTVAPPCTLTAAADGMWATATDVAKVST